MSEISPTSSNTIRADLQTIAVLKDRAAKIKLSLTSNSKLLLPDEQIVLEKAQAQIGIQNQYDKNLSIAKVSINDAILRLSRISQTLGQMLNLASQVSAGGYSHFSERSFQSFFKQVERDSFSNDNKVFNLLSGNSGLYVEVESQNSKRQYTVVPTVNVAGMISFGLLSDLSLSTPSETRQTVSKLSAALASINNQCLSLRACQSTINKLNDGVSENLRLAKNSVRTLTSIDKAQLSLSLIHI